MRGVLAVLALLCTARSSDQATLISPTNEIKTQTNLQELCPNAANDQRIIGDFNLAAYRRQPLVEAVRHRRSLDQVLGRLLPEQGDGVASKLEKLYLQPLVLDSVALQSGTSNLGDTRRLERALYKLVSGQPITMVVLGGSVSVGHGAENIASGWASRVFEWVNATFPHREHCFMNKAIPAISSAYMAPCVQDIVPERTDVVFLEFTFNDSEMSAEGNYLDPTRLALERLLRKILGMTHSPAIVNLHYHIFGVEDGPMARLQPHYWSGAQDQMEMIFKYYSISSLSTRSAFHRILTQDGWLTSKMWLGRDLIHPSCVGHKFMADLVIGFLQDVAASVLQKYRSFKHKPHSAVLLDKLPPPVLLKNSELRTGKCVLDQALMGIKTGGEGWEWKDEGKTTPKTGFVSWKPGNSLLLKVPLEELIQSLPEDRKVLVAVGILMSYEHMGWLRLECVLGCSCMPRSINSLIPFQYSLTYWKAIHVQIDEGSSQCHIQVVNEDRVSLAGENKVKVTSLMVTLEPDSFIESFIEG